MKDYTKFMSYALFTLIDRKTQDDGKSKIKVEALFSHPCQTDNYNAPNKEIKRYLLRWKTWKSSNVFITSFKTSMKNTEKKQFFT